MISLTDHAWERLQQRAPGVDVSALWAARRPATLADFPSNRRIARYRYYVACQRRNVYLLVVDGYTDALVTIIRR